MNYRENPVSTLMNCLVPRDVWAKAQPSGVSATNGVPRSAEKPTNDGSDAGTWQPTIRRIVDFQNLGNNWDGLGAEAPSPEVLQSAIGLAYCFMENGLSPPDAVVAGLDGSVSFEWQPADGSFIEVLVDAPLHAEGMIIEPGKPAQHWTLPTD